MTTAHKNRPAETQNIAWGLEGSVLLFACRVFILAIHCKQKLRLSKPGRCSRTFLLLLALSQQLLRLFVLLHAKVVQEARLMIHRNLRR